MQNKKNISKDVYEELLKEITYMLEKEKAETTCLNILENLSYDLRLRIIKDLGNKNNPKLASFFQLVIKEMDGELKASAERALDKLKHLGYEINPLKSQIICLNQIKAFASPTRIKGSCILVFVVKTEKEYRAHYFTLAFNKLGIKSYFQHTSTSRKEIMVNIKKQNLIELNFEEAQSLLKDAYFFNKRYNTKPVKGFFQYSFLLELALDSQENKNYKTLTRLIGKKLSPQRVVNAYLYALKNFDPALLYDLASLELRANLGERSKFLQNWKHPFVNYTFIKSFPVSFINKEELIICDLILVASDDKDELKKIEFQFYLKPEKENYFLNDVKIKSILPLTKNDKLNPLNYKVYTTSFMISNFKGTKEMLEKMEMIYITGEFEGGYCYKWFQTSDPLEKGIDISEDVYGELILTRNELLVFSKKLKSVTEISYLLLQNFKTLNLNVELKIRTVSTIREVYQVISNPGSLFSSNYISRNNCFLITPEIYQKWYYYCLEASKDIYILDKGVRGFSFPCRDGCLEVILHNKLGVINLYNLSLEDVIQKLKVSCKNILRLNKLTENKKNNWYMLKLIKMLKEDPLMRYYLPEISTKQFASKLNLLIE